MFLHTYVHLETDLCFRFDLFGYFLIMTSPVELYVYDLSNGMARQLSAQLTGRQIDGIW